MYRNKTFNRKKVMIVFVAVFFIMMFLIGRLVYLMIFCSEYYGNKAENLHERERDIKAARGKLLDEDYKRYYPYDSLADRKSVV